MKSRIITLAAVTLLLAAGGCSDSAYYLQAVRGHLDLLTSRQEVDELVEDADTPEALRERLLLTTRMLSFAEQELGLDSGGSYRDYVDVGRPHVVWNVVATPRLSLEPRTWCFPFAGCVPYRGYFAEADALQFAASLRAEGLDVAVSGVPAYSTLGWFDDPLLSTFLFDNELILARLLFHELSHQKLYFKDDTDFNEAFAVIVARKGLERWVEQIRPEQSGAFEALEKREEGFYRLFDATRSALVEIYATTDNDEMKLALKRETLAAFQAQLGALYKSWGVEKGGAWFRDDLNNASFAAAATYRRLVPLLEEVWRQSGRRHESFYAAMESLAGLTPQERTDALRKLASP